MGAPAPPPKPSADKKTATIKVEEIQLPNESASDALNDREQQHAAFASGRQRAAESALAALRISLWENDVMFDSKIPQTLVDLKMNAQKVLPSTSSLGSFDIDIDNDSDEDVAIPATPGALRKSAAELLRESSQGLDIFNKVNNRNRELLESDWESGVVWDVPENAAVPSDLPLGKFADVVCDYGDRNVFQDGVDFVIGQLKQAEKLASSHKASVDDDDDDDRDFLHPADAARASQSMNPNALRKKHLEKVAADNASAFTQVQEHTSKVDDYFIDNKAKLIPVRKAAGTLSASDGKGPVQHSAAALDLELAPTSLSIHQLRRFHRPNVRWFPLDMVDGTNIRGPQHKAQQPTRYTAFSFEPFVSDSKAVAPQDIIQSDLTVSDNRGHVILTEFVQQHPLLVSNIGMGARVRNYYRKHHTEDETVLPVADGERVGLDPDEQSPFLDLGDLNPGGFVQCLDTKMFQSPIFPHPVPDPNSSRKKGRAERLEAPGGGTDFLCVIRHDKDMGLGSEPFDAVITELPRVYVVGQQMLHENQDIPTPPSRKASDMLKDRLAVWLYRRYRERGDDSDTRILEEALCAFPELSEALVKKQLRAVQDDKFPSEDAIRSKMMPEDQCKIDSMSAGQQLLFDAGIHRISEIKPALHQRYLALPRELKKNAQLLDRKLRTTSWNMSTEFCTAVHKRAGVYLQLSGPGDPSHGRTEGFSYLMQPRKKTHKHEALLDEDERIANAEKNYIPEEDDFRQRRKQDTNADLRKLSMVQMHDILRKLKYAEPEIAKMERWSRVRHIRNACGDPEVALELGLSRFARDTRYGVDEKTAEYRKSMQHIFQSQAVVLSSKVMIDENIIDGDDGDDDAWEDMIYSITEKMSKDEEKKDEALKRKQDDLDEESMFLEFKEQLQSGKIGRPGAAKDPNAKVLYRQYQPLNADGSMGDWQHEFIDDPVKIDEIMRNHERAKNADKKMAQPIAAGAKGDIPVLTPWYGLNAVAPVARRPPTAHRAQKSSRPVPVPRTRTTPVEQSLDTEDLQNLKRAQDRDRRRIRNEKERAILQAYLDQGIMAPPNAKMEVQCKACGMFGHLENAARCPLFDDDIVPSEGPVRAEHITDREEIAYYKNLAARNSNPNTPGEGGPVLSIRLSTGSRTSTPAPSVNQSGALTRVKRGASGPPGGNDTGAREPSVKKQRRDDFEAGSSTDVASALLAEINGKFAGLVATLASNEQFLMFFEPVSLEQYSDYLEYVAQPMSLSVIGEKAYASQYHSSAEVMADLELIAKNCHSYCDQRFPGSGLPAIADRMVKGARVNIRQFTDLRTMEKKLQGLLGSLPMLSAGSSQPGFSASGVPSAPLGDSVELLDAPAAPAAQQYAQEDEFGFDI